LKWGYIERSISIPISLPRIGDAVIRIADTDRQFRDLLSVEPSRRRLVEIKIVEEGTSEAAADPIYRGAVTNTTFGPGYCEISIQDMVNAWIDEELPSVINRVNYPNLAEGIDNAFLPIVNGACVSSDDNPQGVIELPHIGFDSANSPPDFVERYGAAIHPIENIALYRQLPGENFYSPVNPDEYVLTEESKVFAEIPTLTATPTYVDFLVQQPDGTKIRADIWGINFRGEWNGIPVANTFQENRNPINFFINMIYLAMAKAGADDSIWEVSTIEAVLDKFYTILDDSPPSGFLCDGAITRAMTVREWLGAFLSNFEIDFYQQKNGKLAIAYVQDTDPSRPLFTAGHDVEINSFYEEIAKPTVNQCRYHFAKNYASNEYGLNAIYDNFTDQDLLGVVSSPPQSIVEAEDFQMDYVRDPDTALFVIRRRMSFLSLGSFRQSWNMDLPNTIADLELAKLVGLTHFDGLAIGGYVNSECKVLGLTIDLDKMKVGVSSILRVPRSLLAELAFGLDAAKLWLLSPAGLTWTQITGSWSYDATSCLYFSPYDNSLFMGMNSGTGTIALYQSAPHLTTSSTFTNQLVPSTSGRRFINSVVDTRENRYVGIMTTTGQSSNFLTSAKSSPHSWNTVALPGGVASVFGVTALRPTGGANDELLVALRVADYSDVRLYKWNSSTGYTNLSFPDPTNCDWITFIEPTDDPDLYLVGNLMTGGFSSSIRPRVWTLRVSTGTWTMVGQPWSLNNASQGGAVWRARISGSVITAIVGWGVGPRPVEVWQASWSAGSVGSWSQIATGNGTFGGSSTLYLGDIVYDRDGNLYAGVGGPTDGQGEVWRYASGVWTKVGGDGVNGSWASNANANCAMACGG